MTSLWVNLLRILVISIEFQKLPNDPGYNESELYSLSTLAKMLLPSGEAIHSTINIFHYQIFYLADRVYRSNLLICSFLFCSFFCSIHPQLSFWIFLFITRNVLINLESQIDNHTSHSSNFPFPPTCTISARS